ncbi:MAG: polyprenyl synthetase family protein [Oligoflexia bacterium]|nr:polyprenyl synthetase family protein [Oligoflexia bacterium]
MNALRTAPTGLHAGAPLTYLPDLGSVFALVSTDFAMVEVELRALLDSTVPAVPEIGRYLADAGGKRLRPLLTALGARAVGHPGPLARLMCVGELLHLGSLLHDDVVDDGTERRGQPAAQKIYGNPAVILTGDFCLAQAVRLAADEAGFQAVSELGRTVTAMAEGEVLQLLNAGNLDLDLHTYLAVVDKKSAALIAWCAAAGAWASGDESAAQALRAYGHNVGVAFQITDDVLDYIGEKRLTGKRRGQDLAERKMTLPLVLAMQQAPELRERLRKGPPSPERIPALIADVRATGACDQALDYARQRVGLGVDALDALPQGPYRDGLLVLAHHLVDRVR